MERLWKAHFYLGGMMTKDARSAHAVKRRVIPDRCTVLVKILKNRGGKFSTSSAEYLDAKREADSIRHYLFRRIFEMLRTTEYDVVLASTLDSSVMHKHSKEWRSVHGFVDVENHRVFVDPRTDMLATLVHEFLHLIYEHAAERTVRDMEWLIISGMSPCRAKKLIAFLHIHAK